MLIIIIELLSAECLLLSQRAKKEATLFHFIGRVKFILHFMIILRIKNMEFRIFKGLNNSTWPVCKHQTTQITSFVFVAFESFHIVLTLLFIMNLCAFFSGCVCFFHQLIAWLTSIVCSSFYWIHTLTNQKPSNFIPGMAVKDVRASSYAYFVVFVRKIVESKTIKWFEKKKKK